MASVQANLYPPEIEKLCRPVDADYPSLKCIEARIPYLDKLMVTLYDKAVEISSHKKLLEREQTIFEESRTSQEDHYFPIDDYSSLLPRVLELAVSLYPEPAFPKNVIKECKSHGMELLAEPANCGAALAFVQKSIEENYKRALASVRDRVALQANQQEWLRNSQTYCDIGTGSDVVYLKSACDYYWNLLRADELAEMAKEGKVLPSALNMPLKEPYKHSDIFGDLASDEETLSEPMASSSENKSIVSDPTIDLTNIGNVKRIQTALSGIYKWIPTKSDDLAAMHYAAIHDFQARNGMPVSNNITQNLLLQLENAANYQKQSGTEKIFLDFDSPKFIRMTQVLLRQLGYSVPDNGVMDQATENAIKDYQAKNGVKVSGKVGPFLIQQLENQTNTFGLNYVQ
ncbi:MAG: peptidoglycan-binding protein [Burkholderiales bacterium]|nr:peptidoglycan-binding protein [Burkholderiales bacterium]